MRQARGLAFRVGLTWIAGLSATQVGHATDVAAPVQLVASDAHAYDAGATSLAFSANRIAMGVRGRDDGGVNRGAVYLFSESTSGWSQLQKITPALPFDREEFGEAVAITGEWLCVGGSKSDRDVADGGGAWLFQWNGASFVEVTRLASPSAVASGAFGCAVVLDVAAAKPLAVLGAQRELVSGVKAGAVHVFERATDGIWNPVARLNAAGVPTENDEFGHAIAVTANRIFVGMPGDDAGAVNAGSVSVFARAGNSWLLEAELRAPGPQTLAEFGANLSASVDRVAVGSYREDGQLTDCGRVHVFVRGAEGWTLEQTIDSPIPVEGGEFGSSVSLDGGWLAVGAVQEFSGGTVTGKVHLFRLSASDPWTAVASIQSNQSQSQEFAGVSVGASGGRVAFGAPFRSAANPYQGAAFVVNLSNDCDNDLIPDLAEFAAGAEDCNANAIPDSCDIAAGMADANGNGVPDLCELPPCLGDVIENGVVDAVDLASVLAVWGTDGSQYPRADTNQDGVVNGYDLGTVLGGWGACPN